MHCMPCLEYEKILIIKTHNHAGLVIKQNIISYAIILHCLVRYKCIHIYIHIQQKTCCRDLMHITCNGFRFSVKNQSLIYFSLFFLLPFCMQIMHIHVHKFTYGLYSLYRVGNQHGLAQSVINYYRISRKIIVQKNSPPQNQSSTRTTYPTLLMHTNTFCFCIKRKQEENTKNNSNTARKKRKFQQYHEIVLILNE